MSIRLNVIYCSPTGTNYAQQAHEETLVTELISQPGLDLNLIGPLEQLGYSPTDRLLLDGLESDMAIASWNSPEQVVLWLQEAGLNGHRTPHRLDPDAPRATAQAETHRKWYLIDLRNLHPAEVLEGLRGILQARRTSTVSLLPGLKKGKDALYSATPANIRLPHAGSQEYADSPLTTPSVKRIDTVPNLTPLSTGDPIAGPMGTETTIDEHQVPTNRHASTNPDKPKDDLDQLMDDLEAWDID